MTKSFIDLRSQLDAKRRVIESGICVCHYEPRGNHGLEGYQLNGVYRYEFVKIDGVDDGYYRVYPCDLPSSYYETCSKRAFTTHFKLLR